MTAKTGTAVAHEVVLRLLSQGSDVCRQARRADLSKSLDIAAARVRRPSTVVCVVGEYKQGKSNVINSLVGSEICTVDDDLATAAITVIGHGPQPVALVHRTDGGERNTEPIPLEDLASFTVETVDGVLPDGVDMVEVAVPSRLLERGITLVDTPGVNSLRPGSERAVIDFLSYADGLVLVSDASAELSPPELKFLAAARRVCPTVVIALSKIDLYPEWRRVASLNVGHLSDIGLSDAIVPISSTLQQSAARDGDTALHAESGFAGLLETMEQGVIGRAGQQARSRAISDLRRVLGTVRTTYQASLDSLEDPEAAEQQLAELRRAETGVTRLRAASARWAVALNDGIGDLRNELDYRLRSSMRNHLQETDRAVADANVKSEWDEMIESLKTSLAEEAEEAFAAIRTGTGELAAEIAQLIADEVPEWSGPGEGIVDVEAMWSSSDRDLKTDGPSVLTSGLSVLRGGYSGMLMLSMLANVAGIALLGPLSIGAGALFGAKQFRDERRRQQEKQRQEARTVLRQFLEQVQLELSTRMQRAIQDAHRALRDYFGDRIRQLSATYAHATRVLEESVAADEARRSELTTSVRKRLADIDEILAATEGPL